MSNIQFTDEDISTFLKNQLEATGLFKVDNSPDKFIRMVIDGKEEDVSTINDSKGVAHPLAIYGSKNGDAVIINPLAEGESGKATQSWWYKTLNTTLAKTLKDILVYLINEVVADDPVKNTNAKKKDKNLKKLDLKAMKYLSNTTDIDAKTLKELNSIIASDLTSFFGIFYNKTAKSSELKCTVFSETRRKGHSSIRTKTWKVLESLILAVLNVKSIDEFTTAATTSGAPVFDSYTHTFVKVLAALQEPAELAGIAIRNVNELQSSINYIPQYHARAKWCLTVEPKAADEKSNGQAPFKAPKLTPITSVAPANFEAPKLNAPVQAASNWRAPSITPAPTRVLTPIVQSRMGNIQANLANNGYWNGARTQFVQY